MQTVILLFLVTLFAGSAVPQQSQSLATVYIYRLRVFQGGGRRMTLSIDGQRFAYLQNGRYWVVKLPPGEHTIADKKPEDFLKFSIQPGSVSYIQCAWAENGLLGFNARFSLNNQETGQADLRRLKPGDVKEVQAPALLGVQP